MSATALFPPAFALPQSPGAAVALILIALAITYALLNVVLRVGPAEPIRLAAPDLKDEEPEQPAVRDEPTPEGAPPPAPAAPPTVELKVEAIRVRGVSLALGDTASQVMRAFHPGEGERLPLIERRPDGSAARVVRAYRVGSRLVILALQRDESGDPLRLTALEIEEF